MRDGRDGHAAVLLPNGKVLVSGGEQLASLASTELFDPATGAWTTVGALPEGHLYHTMNVLPDGLVLAAGGFTGDGSIATASAAFFDPAVGSWTATPSMGSPRAFGTATTLPTGATLLVGGDYADGQHLRTTERFAM